MERRIAVEGCHNFRDLGGYPVAGGGRLRWRTLFRADGLHALTPSGVATLRDEIRLGEIIDLRTHRELEKDGRGPLAEEPIRFHHLPLFGRARERTTPPPDLRLGELYFTMLESASEALAQVLGVLARTDAPAVFHCAAGKDRTGVVSALLLGLLGVPDEVIVSDYAATSEALEDIVRKLRSSRGYEKVWDQLPPETLHAEPETMETLLDRVRETYGGMHDYARAIGVSEADLDRLRERMSSPE